MKKETIERLEKAVEKSSRVTATLKKAVAEIANEIVEKIEDADCFDLKVYNPATYRETTIVDNLSIINLKEHWTINGIETEWRNFSFLIFEDEINNGFDIEKAELTNEATLTRKRVLRFCEKIKNGLLEKIANEIEKRTNEIEKIANEIEKRTTENLIKRR